MTILASTRYLRVNKHKARDEEPPGLVMCWVGDIFFWRSFFAREDVTLQLPNKTTAVLLTQVSIFGSVMTYIPKEDYNIVRVLLVG